MVQYSDLNSEMETKDHFRNGAGLKNRMMKGVNLILITTLLISSCVSTKKYSGFVKPKFENLADVTKEEYGNITFDLSKLERIEDIVISEKLKSQFIPAILYWQWENNIACQISPQSVGKMLNSNIMYQSDLLGLSEKLGNKKLEITIEEIPSSFIYANKGHTIIFIIAYTISQLEAIYPKNQDFVITYVLRENGQTNISEEIRITNKDVPMRNIWSTTGKFTRNYLEQFENNIKETAKDIVQVILTQCTTRLKAVG